MKRFVCLLILCIATISFAFGFSYKLELLSFDPLYEGYAATKESPDTSFHFNYSANGIIDHVYVPNNGDGKYYFELDGKHSALTASIKVGETISLLRNTFSFGDKFPDISLDLSFQGSINFLTEYSIADIYGYDGTYFYGITGALGDYVSFRLGYHHDSNHYGDYVFDRIEAADKPYFGDTKNYMYSRMNGNVIALSAKPLSWLRIYGEYNWMGDNPIIYRPDIFRPSYMQKNPNIDYPSSYKARVINFGFEISYPIFKKLGNTTLAYDCHLYEEGKAIYFDPSTGSYLKPSEVYFDQNAPWDVEHSILLRQQLNSYCSFDVGFHSGRAPLNIFYHIQDASYLTFGFSLKAKGGVKIVSTT